jgi:hypothetical protein
MCKSRTETWKAVNLANVAWCYPTLSGVIWRSLRAQLSTGLFLAGLRQQLAQFVEQRPGLVDFTALRQQPFDLMVEAALVFLGLRYEPAVLIPAGPDRYGHAVNLRHAISPRIFNLMQIASKMLA